MSKKPTYEELKQKVLDVEKVELERQKTEEQFMDEISRHHLLFDQSRDGIVVLRQDGKVYEANRHFADMLGCSLEEVYQLHVWDWDCYFSREQLFELIEEVSSSGHHFETRHRRKDGTIIDVELSNSGTVYRGEKLIFCICRDISGRKKIEKEREKLIEKLQKALAEIKTLRGIIPICSHCKKIRDDKGYWEQVEAYISKHSEAHFSHGICPECMEKFYPDICNDEDLPNPGSDRDNSL